MTDYADTLEQSLPIKKRINEVEKRLEDASVKYVLSSWIDLFGIPKTKPAPMADFEQLCMGKGPQFADHSISYVPELCHFYHQGT